MAPKRTPDHHSTTTCRTCEGCGRVANDGSNTPWIRWLQIPLGSSIAVLTGLVRAIPCPDCKKD